MADEVDLQLRMVDTLLPLVPDGYFAVAPDDRALVFCRLSTPKHGAYKGSRKFQTQHAEELHLRAVRWLEGTRAESMNAWQVFGNKRWIADLLTHIVSSWQEAALLYAREIGKCCRCNTTLTDERSRHYGIGPDCEKIWPWVIARVDQDNNDLSYEELPR